jgi:FtsH-binding integral membrane protein
VRDEPQPVSANEDSGPLLAFDRHLVLEQLGGWRGTIDASLPTVAFVVANAIGGLRAGVWAALGLALLVFLLRLVRRESVQQAISGLLAVGVAVAIAAGSGQARDFFVFGILRNAVLGVLLVGSVPLRRPLIGVLAEFLAPSHLGALASASVPGLGRFGRSPVVALDAPPQPVSGPQDPDPEPERPWRDDRRLMRVYSWLTLMWGATFLLRVAVQALLYQKDQVALLGTTSLILGLPVTAVAVAVTFWAIARLHRHRSAPAPA